MFRSSLRIALQISEALFLAACITVALTAFAKPGRVDPAPKKEGVPRLALDRFATNWGAFIQDGSKVTLRGHEHWEANGVVEKHAGKWRVVLLWTLLADGKIAPGVYQIGEDGSLSGLWAWGEDVTVEDGEYRGLSMMDRVYKRE